MLTGKRAVRELCKVGWEVIRKGNHTVLRGPGGERLSISMGKLSRGQEKATERLLQTGRFSSRSKRR